MASPFDFIAQSIAAHNGSATQTSSAPTSPSSRRTSPLEDYYNEKQQKQATEKARDIVDDRGRGSRSYARESYLERNGGVKSTTVDSRGHSSTLRNEYQRQHPNIPTMSTALSDDEKFQLQSAYADAANKYKDASKKAQSIRPEEGLDYATTLEKYHSAQQSAIEEKAAAESEMDKLRKQLEFYNVDIPDLDQNVFQRTWGALKGGSKQAAGSLGGAAGYTGRVTTSAQNAVDRALRASGNEELSALYDVGTEEENAKAMQMQQSIADKSADISESGGRDIERSKWGASKAGRFALDAASQIPALAADTAVNLLAPGAGTAMMMARAFGGGVQEAESSGADLGRAGAYGAASAAVETLTEKLTGGLDIAYGKGFTDKVTEKLIGKLAKSDAGRTALRAVTGAFGEGVEETLSSAINPTIRAIYNGKSIGENYSEEQISDWLYDGLVGAALGLVGQGANIATGENAKKNAELRRPETEAQAKATAETQARQQAEAETQANATRAVLDDILSRGRVNQQQTAQIMSSPEFTRMFEALTGRKLEGNTNQQRTEIQQAAREYAYNKGEQAQQAAAERRAEAERQSTAEQTQTEAERALSEYSQQEAARDAEWAERRQQMENYGSYDSYVRGLIRDGMTPAEAGEIARNPQMREAWERVTGQKLPTDSTNRARQMIMETRADVPMPQNQAPATPQNSVQAQGDISTPPTPSNDAVARPEELNSTVNNNAEMQTTDAQKNTAPTGTESTSETVAIIDRLKENIPNLESDSSVAVTSSDSVLQTPGNTMAEKARQLFSKIVGNVSRAGFGDVEINNRSMKDDLSHGIGMAKAAVIPAIPDVIKNGKQIDFQSQWKGRPYDGYVFAAPVDLDGRKVYVAAIVKQTSKNRFYLHEVVDSDGNIIKINGGEKANPTSLSSVDGTGTSSPPITPTQGVNAETVVSNTSIPTAEENVNSGQTENSGRPFEPTYNSNAPAQTLEKLSQFWENTLQKNEAAAGTPEEVSQPLSYLPKTEKQSLAEAASRLSADRQGTVENLVNSEAWSGVQADAAWQIASDLYSEAARTGNYEAYTSWRKVMQEHTTAGAQGLQAQAKYTRHNGENALDSIASAIADSKLTEAQQKALIDKVGTYATRFDNITRGIPDATIPTAASSGKPSADLVSLIEEMARERKTWTFKDNVYSDLLKKQNNAYLKEYAYRQLIAMGNDSLATVSSADKVKAVQSMAQLSSIATFARNIGGNVTFGAVDTLTQNGFGVALDSLVSKATGKRTVAVDKGWFSSDARKGSIDAMQKSILEVAGDVDMGGENRYGQSSGRAYKMTGSPVERFMSRWQQLMGYSLTTSDKFSRGGIEAEQVRGLSELKNSGLTDAEIQQLASTMADYRLFQNQGMAYKASKTIHDAFNVLGFGGRTDNTKLKTRQGGFGLGDLVNTYPGVPANLGVKALEYSPANVLKGGVELINLLKSAKQGKVDATKQQQAVMDISRGLAGVPAFALFAALTKAGFIRNWDDEDNKDVKAQNAAEGKSGIQVNLDGALRWLKGEENALEWRNGDTLDSIGWLEPINAFMAIGTLMAQEPEDASVWSYVGDIAEGSIQAFLDIPVVSNLADMVDTLQYSNAETWTGKAAEAGIQYLGNMATGFVPSFIRGVAKATDPYYRDTTGNNAAEAALNSLKATIPGLRETLPKKLDNFGNEKMYSGNIAERLFNTLANPGDRTTIRQGSASSMLEKLRNETGDANIYPDRKAPKSVEYDDVESKLTPEQKREWQRTAGQLSEKLINDLKDSGTFDRLTPQQQAQVVKSINSLAKDTAKQQFVESTGTDYTSDYDAIRELKSPSEFLTAKKALNDAKDKTKANFDAVDQVLKNFGLLKDDTQALLRDSGLSVDKLLYAAETGIDSEEWYDTYNAIKEHRNETGRESQWVSAEAIGSQVKGDDAAKLKALEAQLPPDDDGKRKTIVKRYAAAIDSGISWDDWTAIEKVVNNGAGSWGSTSGTYSGEKNVKAALREAGYTSSQAERIWRVYKKTSDKKYQRVSNDTSSSSSTSSNSVSTRSAEEYFRALGLLK